MLRQTDQAIGIFFFRLPDPNDDGLRQGRQENKTGHVYDESNTGYEINLKDKSI